MGMTKWVGRAAGSYEESVKNTGPSVYIYIYTLDTFIAIVLERAIMMHATFVCARIIGLKWPHPPSRRKDAGLRLCFPTQVLALFRAAGF